MHGARPACNDVGMTTTPAAPGRPTITTRQVGVIVAGALLGALLVFVSSIALVDSYWHARWVAHEYGSRLGMGPDMARWRPLTTDGLLLAVFAVIYWRRITRQSVHWLLWSAAALAGAGTLLANLVAGQHSLGGFIVAGWAPLTMVVTDFAIAVFIPPLVAAWKAGRPAAPPAPTPAAEPAEVPMDFAQVPWTGDPVGPAEQPAAELDRRAPATTTQPDEGDDVPWGQHPADVVGPPRREARAGEAVSVAALTGRASALHSVPAPAVGVRWTEDDEAKLRILQARVDAGGKWPTPNSMKVEWGMNEKRAKKIIARVVRPEEVTD